jgi:alpha-N-arabinofuranosidase
MNHVVIEVNSGTQRISRNLYGHFAEHLGRCIYEGIWVGTDSDIPNTRGIRDDVVAALRHINVPVLRWPGGCFADDYHWRDGIGAPATRPAVINTHWGGVVENNHFGTHEFLDLCEQIATQPYICGNVGSGTVQELRQWVEYITFDGHSPMADLRRANGRDSAWSLPFVGVGNESWGCGGNMRPQFYADLYRQYQTYVRDFGGNHVFKIACGANADDYTWTDVLMREAGRLMDGLSLHYYTVPGPDWEHKGSATDFEEAAWFHALQKCLRMDELIREHGRIMDRHDPEKRVALVIDEWGTWHDVEPGTNPGFLYQQNTMRDALVAALSLHIFNSHADRVRMANLAQTVNVLQALILTDGPRMITTPTYHVFDLFKGHQDAMLLPSAVTCDDYVLEDLRIPQISVSASRSAAGRMHITLCNTDPQREADVLCTITGARVRELESLVLSASEMTACNTFEEPNRVAPAAFEQMRVRQEGVSLILPPMSVVAIAGELD